MYSTKTNLLQVCVLFPCFATTLAILHLILTPKLRELVEQA
jgi:hypothetical protein